MVSSKTLMVGLALVMLAALGLGWATPDNYTYEFETQGRIAQFYVQNFCGERLHGKSRCQDPLRVPPRLHNCRLLLRHQPQCRQGGG